MSEATVAVHHMIGNIDPYYTEWMRIVQIARWDEPDNTWSDVPKAARELKTLVAQIDPKTAGFGDLASINLDRDVDWEELITGELEVANRAAGRAARAGL